MPDQPRVSVLLSTFNDLQFLHLAVQSILRQDLSDWEFIIVDDGSTDGTAAYLRSLSDPRIRSFRHERNLGLAASLNLGLARCSGTYVARMDADDIAEPDRLRLQCEFLQNQPATGIAGSSRRLIDTAGRELGIATPPLDDVSIRWKCLLGNPLPHPTIMIRRELLCRHKLRYDESFRTAQDYELWTRLLPLTRAANLPLPLLRYRVRAQSISGSRREEQLINHDRIARTANRMLLGEFLLTPAEVTGLRGRFGGESVRDHAQSQSDERWVSLLRAMLEQFASQYAGEPGIDELLQRQRRWIDSLRIAASNS